MTSRADFLQYGLTQLPSESIGFDSMLYKEKQKNELYTDTKNYLSKRQAYLTGLKPKINQLYLDTMGDGDMAHLPLNLRTKFAQNVTTEFYNTHKKIAEELWPNVNKAFDQYESINVANNILDKNIVAKVKKPRKSTKKVESSSDSSSDEEVVKKPAKKAAKKPAKKAAKKTVKKTVKK